MAVKVIKDGSTIKFYPESPADHDTADYLCRLVNEAKALVANADPGTVAKSGIGGIALIRKDAEQRLQVLKSIIDREEAKSRDWSLTWEIRQLANERAFAAKDESRRIATELEGR